MLLSRSAVTVPCGGDGTVTSVLTQMPGRGIPVVILPQGTANNIARLLGGSVRSRAKMR
jgi:diacylglycerol kinase family enzyme